MIDSPAPLQEPVDYKGTVKINNPPWVLFFQRVNAFLSNTIENLSGHILDTTTHGTTGDIVGTSDVQTLSNKELSNTNSIGFDLTPTSVPVGVGVASWNTVEDTLDIQATNQTTQVGQELSPLYRNMTGSTITNGTPVMFAGSVGASGRIKIQKAIANGTIPAKYIIGLTTEDIANGSDGHVTWFGKVRGLNTSGTPYGEVWADGDVLYVSPTTAGYLTKTPPNAPNLQITVAAVVFANPAAGTLFIRPTFESKMSDMDDVNGTALTTSGQIPVWNQTASYFDFTKNINDYATDTELSTHIADTTTHGTTGDIVGTSDTQILTNKKFGDSSNYTTFEADGTKVLVGNATVWEDENFSGVALGVGPTPPDLIDYNSTSIKVRGFDGSAITESLFGGAEYPHKAKVGADISFHVHWAPTTNAAGSVKWQLAYVWVNVDGTATAETVISVTQASSGTAWAMHKIAFPTVSGAGKGFSSQIGIRLFRNPTDVADTYPDDAAICFTFGFHYEIDTDGSRQITTK